MGDKTIIVAEAGVNHNGDIRIAKKLIEAAKFAGADYVKFQTFNAEELVTKYSPKANYQIRNTNNHESQYKMLKKLEINDEFHDQIYKYCLDIGIGFLSSAFSENDLHYLRKFNMDFIKIPSGEITNYRYLKIACKHFSKVILSTGMANLLEIKNAIYLLKNQGIQENEIFLLQCSTEYPTSFENVNLNVLKTFQKEFKCKTGYSDHTLGL